MHRALSLSLMRLALCQAILLILPALSHAATVAIDLDRNTEGVQGELTVHSTNCAADIQGAVVVIGEPSDTVGDNVTQVLGVNPRVPDEPSFEPDGQNAGGSLALCDIPNGFIPATGGVYGTYFIWVSVLHAGAVVGSDGVVCLFTFDVSFLDISVPGDTIQFSFQESRINPAIGISINFQNYSYGPEGENPPIESLDAVIFVGEPSGPLCPTKTRTPTPSETLTSTQTRTASRTRMPTGTATSIFTLTATPTLTPSPTPSATRTLTPTLAPCADTGYYLLTSFGDHIRIGSPPQIRGSLFSAGEQHFGGMEPAADSNGHVDLAILDHSGVVTYVGDPGSTPPQDFMFPETPEFPMGRAVDVEVTPSGQGFFVLTDFGGIYRAGDAKLQEEQSLVPDTDRMGVLGYDILFGALRVPTAANPGGASIRAVALLVLYVNAGVEGYLILDSQGGHYQLLASGQPVPVGTYNGLQQHSPFRLLEPGSGGYSWPFFPGWDIARDMELMPVTGDGLVIFNGWGGIHPVPAFDRTNAVYYLTNRDPAHPGHVLTTVGMPYVVAGFDDPDTPADESDPALFGIDAASIFTDLEFCRTGDGIYTMDKFGAVFAFGSARAMPDSTAPPFTHIPYFFPFLWAQDMEPMEPETMFGQETDFTVDLPNLATDARPLRLVRIPAGTFQMGSPNTERGRYRDWEGPVHTVTLTHDFYIGEAEVTQAQWKALMGSNPATDLGYTPYGVGNDYPVYYVSWDDCQSFITALNALGQGTFRLPTEAEWEYACRARTTTRFYFGDSLECGDENQDCAAGTLPGNRSDYMWYWFNYNTPTFGSKPVHGKMPNAFGLYDMHGNVWEWCQDWFQEDFYSQPGATAPNPLCTDSASGYRVFRGGYWSVDAVYCRSAFRSRYVPGTRVTNIGLRVVRLA